MTTAISTLESELVAYLSAAGLTWAASITGASDPRHADEEQYGILGAYTAVPAVIVQCDDAPAESEQVPVYRVPVTVTVRSSTLRSLVATHRTRAEAVAAAMFSEAAVNTALSDSLIVSAINPTGESFTRNGRALETRLSFTFTISGKE